MLLSIQKNENVLLFQSDFYSLDEASTVHNNQLAFSILEKELGIPPVMSPTDLVNSDQIDKLSMVLYLTQIHNAFTVPLKGMYAIFETSEKTVERKKKRICHS